MPNQRRAIKLGIIGCGRVAKERHLPALQHIPDAQVVAVADIKTDRVHWMAERFGIERQFNDYRDLLDCADVEAVGILTPTASHAEIGLASLESGKHVLIEKPLALNLEECDQLIASASHFPYKVVVGFNLRWHRLVRRARKIIESGSLGRIKAVRSACTHYRLGEYAPAWHRKHSLGGGVAFNEAVHHFDLWNYLLQTEVEQVFSFSRPSIYYEDETHVTSASLRNGALATGIFTLRTSPNSEVEIYGDAGRLYLSCYRFDGLDFFSHTSYPGDITSRLKKVAQMLRGLSQAVPVLRRGGDFASTFCGLWRHFIDCITRDVPSECTVEDGKHALRVAIAAVESAASGQPVKIKEDVSRPVH
jgi:myo-inositol 2-dehydrogenase/D-chiro-inositol 1-dehydrogenase